MQENHLYEYAVIRIVPRVERGEFINAGIIMFCKKSKFLKCRYEVNSKKILSLFPGADVDLISKNLLAFETIANGRKEGGPIALLEVPERFRWLTAVRSTIIQTSQVHPGLSSDNDNVFERLFNELVGEG